MHFANELRNFNKKKKKRSQKSKILCQNFAQNLIKSKNPQS